MGKSDLSHETDLFDIVILKGMIVDGKGCPIFKGDIAIKDDKIVDIGNLGKEIKAKKVIEAKDKVVSPGFIDMHTHVDEEVNNCSILSDQYIENFVMQGTTTVIGGNCGISPDSIKIFLEKVNTIKTGPNVGLLVGHKQVREAVLGMDNRKPNSEELEKMKLLVRKGMEEGAFGLSSGLGYSPGSYADLNEMVELCKVVAEYNGFYSSHIREQSKEIENSWQEIINTGELSGAHAHIAHVQVIGQDYWGISETLIKNLNEARNRGVNVTCEGYPYESGATTIVGALIPNWVQAEGKMKDRLRDDTLLVKIKTQIESLLSLRGGAKAVLITSCPNDKLLEKRYLDDIALEWKINPVDALIKIALELDDTLAIYFHSSEKDKEMFFSSPYCAVGSDSFCVLNDRLCGNLVHPRSYGTMPNFLSEYVKLKKVMSLEEGIRRMTSLPAEILGINDRGVLSVGKKADIVILDYDKIADSATYVDPHHYPSGIEYVIINGKVAVDKGLNQKILSGIALKNDINNM